jgi:hypothetical protein
MQTKAMEQTAANELRTAIEIRDTAADARLEYKQQKNVEIR